MYNLRKTALVLVALLASGGAVRAADASRPAPKQAKPDITAPANSGDVQKLIQQFNQRRDSILADREALMNQLKNATAEQRKLILGKMQAQQKDLIEAQRALGKQIRDEMRKLRQNTPGPGRR